MCVEKDCKLGVCAVHIRVHRAYKCVPCIARVCAVHKVWEEKEPLLIVVRSCAEQYAVHIMQCSMICIERSNMQYLNYSVGKKS